ncbi:Protein GrpE [Buchnera aphidicola (Tetraneura ulmi)]
MTSEKSEQKNNKVTNKEKNNKIEIENPSRNLEFSKEIKINLQKKINNLKKKIFDVQLRTQANIENLKKDTQKKIKEIKKQKKEEIITNLIPIVDNFEKINEQIKKNQTIKNEKIIEGISLTLFNLKNDLKKIGVQPIILKNKIFNPNFHETQNKFKFDEKKIYKIKSTVKKGYIYKNKILRKSIVLIDDSKKNEKKI